MADLGSRIGELSPAKQALLAQRLAERHQPSRTIPRRAGGGPVPLSFAQTRLWFLDQLDPGSPTYNIPFAVRLRGRLDAGALAGSLDALVARHEALRTTFGVVDGEPVQVIAVSGTAGLRVVDLADGRATAGKAERLHEAGEEARRPFDLGRGPLFRPTLFRLGADDHILLLSMHHIVSDGWSMGILARELGALYTAALAGAAVALPDLPVQYADYAVWQRGRLQGDTLEAQLAYWKGQLAGVPAILDLPADRPRPAVQSHRGAREPVALPRALVDALHALARRERVTFFMALLAGFQALLARYTGQTDIVVGSPTAGRTSVDVEGLIGFFVNTLALRVNVADDPTFRGLLQRVRDVTLKAYSHQDVPFERLVEELAPERDLSRNPLVQVLFVLQNTPRAPLGLPGLDVEVLRLDTDSAKVDLTLSLTESADGLEGRADYATDLFDGPTIARLVRHFRTLLEGAVADPDRRVSALPLLGEAERRQILVDWNATARDYPRDATLPALFEARAARAPDAVAVVFDDARLTYGELDRRANRLAHHLAALGVTPGSRVGICLERSAATIVAVLAVLKAGGAYVPLDPTYPAGRLAFMCEDSGIRVLVTGPGHAPDLAPGGPAVVDLAGDAEAIARRSDDAPGAAVTADSPAYVMYTSGSTGQPKGVVVPHRAVVRLVANTDYVTLGPADVIAQASTFSFDAATFEIWGALLNGARLAGIPTAVLLSPEALVAALERHGVTTIFLTTALFNEVARARPDAFARLRDLLFGGEAADPGPVRAVLEHGPPRRLLNVYGPTETTTFAAWHLVEAVPATATTIPIGRPIANAELYVLDRHRQPVPVGVAGELHIGGDGLALGYGNHPELTAEKFVPHPFSPAAGARLYRTGDLARFRPDGAIEFLGRIDRQIKLRGFRIEPGEIEAALERHPGVHGAAVVLREDRPGERRLVAYLVPRAEPAPAAGELARFLGASLPDYMIPAAFVALPSLPLTPSGKIDRAALPAPAPPETEHVPPRTPTEEALARAWREVLGLETAGVHDNFFEVGGHSLAAIRLLARVRDAFGVEVPVRAFFEAPTIAGIAAVLDERLLAELEEMSDDEAQRRLTEEPDAGG